MPGDPKRPLPGEFDDYRAYLRAMIAFQKATNPRFSYRYFSRRAGFRSPNFLKLVAEGDRNLSLDSIEKFAKAMELNASEHEAFEALVLLGQARTPAERERYHARLRASPAVHSPTARLEREQYEVYARWYALPIREMMMMPDFQEDPEWIAARLRPAVTPDRAKEALELLERVGLVVRGPDGRLTPAETKVATPPTVRTMATRKFHRAMLRIATEAIEHVAVERRNVTSLTVTLTRPQYEQVCQRIERFRAELLDMIDDEPRGEQMRDVYVLGFQAVPMTNREKG